MVHRPQTILVALLLGISGCTPALEYPPPAQKILPKGVEPLLGSSFVHMGDATVDGVIVQDILGTETGSSWRWSNQHPRIKVWFHPGLPTTLYVRFTLAGVVLKQTGPITIRGVVNGQTLEPQTFSQEHEYEYTKTVPSSILGASDEAVIGLDIDPVYVSPTDGVKLGVLLQEFGLKQAGVE